MGRPGLAAEAIAPRPVRPLRPCDGLRRAARTHLLNGGLDVALKIVGDTWEWDGIDWIRRLPPSAPSPRASLAMAFDPRRVRTVLFGGGSGTSILGDTWEWDRELWARRSPGTSTVVNPQSHDESAVAHRLVEADYPARLAAVGEDLTVFDARFRHGSGKHATHGPLEQYVPIAQIKRLSLMHSQRLVHQ